MPYSDIQVPVIINKQIFKLNKCVTHVTDQCINLRGADDGFSGSVTATNHHLLCEENFLCGNFNAKVTARHHDTVGLFKNLVKADVTTRHLRLPHLP